MKTTYSFSLTVKTCFRPNDPLFCIPNWNLSVFGQASWRSICCEAPNLSISSCKLESITMPSCSDSGNIFIVSNSKFRKLSLRSQEAIENILVKAKMYIQISFIKECTSPLISDGVIISTNNQRFV